MIALSSSFVMQLYKGLKLYKRCQHLSVSLLQFFLYETITEQRKEGKTFDQIAEWLNEEGYLSVRGKKFRGAHVHSIVKKKRLKDEKMKKEYPEIRSDFYLDIVNKTILMSKFTNNKR